MSRRIHITGASGAGTTTLGEHLARALRCDHFDTDDYYWLPTDPPFRIKRDVSERLHRLEAVLRGSDYWVLSGSLDGWGDPLIPLFTSVVFLETPTEIRLSRLRQRGTMAGSSRSRHEAWLAKLGCPVIVVAWTIADAITSEVSGHVIIAQPALIEPVLQRRHRAVATERWLPPLPT